MKLLERIGRRWTGRHHLRRVSLRRAQPIGSARRRAPIEHVEEKLLVAGVAGAAATVLLGLGAIHAVRDWCALVALCALAGAGVLRYFADFRREAVGSLPRVVALCVTLLLPLTAVSVARAVGSDGPLTWLPLSFVSLILAVVWGRAVALAGTLVCGGSLLLFLGLRGELVGPSLGGLGVALGGGIAAALASESVKRRSSLVRVGMLVGCVQATLFASFSLLEGAVAPTATQLGELVSLAAAGLVVGLLISGLLPAIEALFEVTTDVSLLELSSTHEAPLLRKLLLEASGTFHHSYIVGLLAEAAAEAIGANALLARTGALYHDVGKLNKPEYFAENSSDARERHANLAPEMSMLIIAAHTRDGIELGRYYGLPACLLDFMVEHHGTTRVDYFYQRAVELRGEESVSEATFRYSGPKPRTRESAIVMIADAAEAISRQMADPTPARLAEMVHSLALQRLLDGQFGECGLTLEELTRIEEACVQVLVAIYHARQTFPTGKPHALDLSQPRPARPGTLSPVRAVGADPERVDRAATFTRGG